MYRVKAPPWMFFRNFPKLLKTPQPFEETSDYDPKYNCHAYAMGDEKKRWDPIDGYWPQGCPREMSIQAFVNAFETQGYKPCDNGNLEPNYEKIALYANQIGPSHTAKQQDSGRWRSKLGEDADIEHNALGLEGPLYGKVVMFFSRHRKSL
ncbi:MAG: hypothetical protein WC476_07115 [Phycisphaerae bacterium]|jgi:hypothetical protein